MTRRFSSSTLTGMLRTDVAVGTVSDVSMFATIFDAAPRNRTALPDGEGTATGRGGGRGCGGRFGRRGGRNGVRRPKRPPLHGFLFCGWFVVVEKLAPAGA